MPLQIDRLEVRYPREPVPAIDLRNIVLNTGAPCIISASSGTGKTTLFRALAGWFDDERSGVICNRSWCYHSPTNVDFVGNHSGLVPWKRVLENVELLSACRDRETILSMFAAVGLDHTIYKRWPYEISLGMYKRVEFVAGILGRREVLILDEFFASLDEATAVRCADLITRYRAGLITLISSHQPETVPLHSAVRWMFIRNSNTVVNIEELT